MADYIPVNGAIRKDVKTPLTLTALQTFVGGFIRFVELSSGDLMVVNEASVDGLGFLNPNASSLAGYPVYGSVVMCIPEEIE